MVIVLAIALMIAVIIICILLNVWMKSERGYYEDERKKDEEVQRYKKYNTDLNIQIRHLEDEAVSLKKSISILKNNERELKITLLNNEKEIRHLNNQLIQKR